MNITNAKKTFFYRIIKTNWLFCLFIVLASHRLVRWVNTVEVWVQVKNVSIQYCCTKNFTICSTIVSWGMWRFLNQPKCQLTLSPQYNVWIPSLPFSTHLLNCQWFIFSIWVSFSVCMSLCTAKEIGTFECRLPLISSVSQHQPWPSHEVLMACNMQLFAATAHWSCVTRYSLYLL